MQETPSYFKFRQWLHLAMKDDPLGDEHFHASDVYQNTLTDKYEIIPAVFMLSNAAAMLDDARKYFQKQAYSSKIPVFFCGLNEIEKYNPNDFEHDDSIPDVSTLEKTTALCTDDVSPHAQVFYYVTRPEVWQEELQRFDYYKFICTSAPSWFGTQYNMIYRKKMLDFSDSSLYTAFQGHVIIHDIVFYHNDATDYYPFEMNKWHRCLQLHR